jgi:chromosome segregation ATPase
VFSFHPAAQIIDQDAEFAEINAKLKEKNAEIASMSQSVNSSKLDARKIASLQRRLDDCKDEKEHLLERVDELTRQLEQAASAKEGFDDVEVERLSEELKKVKLEKEASEERLTKQIESLRKLRNHAVDDFEAKIRARDNQIASLENELLDLKDRAFNSNAFDIDLNGNPAPTQEQLDELTDKCIELGDERDNLKQKIAMLNDEINTLRASSESQLVSELRAKLAQSEAMRESVEKNRSMFTSNRDSEIDRLHKQLSETKEKQSQRELEQSARLKVLERDNHELREDFATRIKEKNARIVALEQTLAAQEQVVGNMSSEMDQLQNGMEKISVQRRAEIEEMQQELMDYTSKATRLEREVSSLSLTLNEKRHQHKAEVERLKQKIAALESESPFARDIRHAEKDDNREKIELTEKIEVGTPRLLCFLLIILLTDTSY